MSAHEEPMFGFLIGRAYRSLVKYINRKLIQHGQNITLEQWVLLKRLLHKDGRNQQELAECTDRDKVTITKLIDGLEKRKLVERRPCVLDRRKKYVFLTQKGMEVKDSVMKIVRNAIRDSLKGLSDDEIKLMEQILMKVYENTNDSVVEKI